jgi:hypothetical protein
MCPEGLKILPGSICRLTRFSFQHSHSTQFEAFSMTTFLETMTALATNLRAGGDACMRVRDGVDDHRMKGFLHRLSTSMGEAGRQIDGLIAVAPEHVRERLAALEIEDMQAQ